MGHSELRPLAIHICTLVVVGVGLLIMMGLAWPLDLVQVALVLSLYIAYTTLSLISNRFVKHCLVC